MGTISISSTLSSLTEEGSGSGPYITAKQKYVLGTKEHSSQKASLVSSERHTEMGNRWDDLGMPLAWA